MKFLINIIIGLLLAGAIFFGVKYFMDSKDTTAGQAGLATTKPAVSAAAAGSSAVASRAIRNDDYLILLKMADAITFKSPLFDDEAFLQLEDFHQPLPERAVGRVNPFAPIGRTTNQATSTGARGGR